VTFYLSLNLLRKIGALLKHGNGGDNLDLLIIDENKCKKDGICAGECPVAIIKLKDSFPRLIPGGDAICLRCGHCVAVCPHGALGHANIHLEDCPPIRKELAVTEEQAVQFLRSRRSTRLFKDKPVEKDKIKRLIEIARYAPTGGNSQLVEWLVVTDRDKIHDLSGATVDWMRHVLKNDPQALNAPYIPMILAAWDTGYDSVLRAAPVLIIASAPKEANTGMVDLTIALSYLDLVAPSLGLGACWAGLLQGAILSWKPLKEALGLPAGHPYHYPIMIGYPETKYYRLPERKPPKITWK